LTNRLGKVLVQSLRNWLQVQLVAVPVVPKMCKRLDSTGLLNSMCAASRTRSKITEETKSTIARLALDVANWVPYREHMIVIFRT
jgi:hypothetical protein